MKTGILLFFYSFAIGLFSEVSGQAISTAYSFILSDINSSTMGVIHSVDRACAAVGYCARRYDVTYTYTVDDAVYYGDIVSFRGRATHEDVYGKYWPGKMVVVYYDRAAPQHAVLENSPIGGRVVVPLVLMLLPLIYGFFKLVSYFYRAHLKIT